MAKHARSTRSPRDFEPEKYDDTYREEVLALIERKAEGKEIAVQPAPEEEAEPVPDLMARAQGLARRGAEGRGAARSPPPSRAGQEGPAKKKARPSAEPPAVRVSTRRMAQRLRRSDCTGPGLARRRRGKGFEYLDPDGERVDGRRGAAADRRARDPARLGGRLDLPVPGGHIQATGVDDRGRKQYLYHPRWRERRDQQKFDDMVVFARALPALRERVAADLGGRRARPRRTSWPARCGCWTAASSASAPRTTRSPTRATGSRRCASATRVVKGDKLLFDYPAKSGKRRVQAVVDPEIADTIKRLKQRRGGGDELLAYKRSGRWADVRSHDINAYLKEATELEISAKDFRTWGATVMAAVALGVAGPAAGTKTGRKRAITRAVKEVAYYLGNTPAVARASYIDPRVFDRYRDGVVIAVHDLESSPTGPRSRARSRRRCSTHRSRVEPAASPSEERGRLRRRRAP